MPENTLLQKLMNRRLDSGKSIMKRNILKNINLDFSNIKIFLSDVDGVMTDAGIYTKMVMSLKILYL